MTTGDSLNLHSQSAGTNIWDVLIVGGGPAGMAAAVESRTLGRNVVLVHDQPLGGLLRAGRRVDQYPGIPGPLSGIELSERLAWQCGQSQASLLEGKVVALRRDGVGPLGSGLFRAELADGGQLISKSVVLATGTQPSPLPFAPLEPGADVAQPNAGMEKQVAGNSSTGGHEPQVHRDVRTMPTRLHGQQVVVVGGGEAAMDSALWPADRGAHVTLVVRVDKLKGNPALVAQCTSRVPVLWNMALGRDFIRRGIVPNEVGAPRRPMEGVGIHRPGEANTPFDHLLVCVGRVPRLDLWHSLWVDETQAPPLPHSVQTSVPGLFMAGDVIRQHERYAALATADGVVSAHLAMEQA